MTKNIAWFDEASAEQVVEALLVLGLTMRCPTTTGPIVAFSRLGDETAIETETDALAFLLAGNGVSLWIDHQYGPFVSVYGPNLVAVYFDGFTPTEELGLVRRMKASGLTFDVLHEEDVPFPAGRSCRPAR